LFCCIVQAQQMLEPTLPDSPGMVATLVSDRPSGPADYSSSNGPDFVPQGGTSLPQTHGEIHQTKRILGIIPNFRAVSANQVLPPQSAKEKFITATEDSFDYSALLLPATLAGYSMVTNATPEFHQGAAGYDRIGSLSCLRKEAKQE
jgi:hypothetical protein